MKSRVLLLGGTGFIGSRVLDALLAAGYEVTCGIHRALPRSKCRTIAVDYSRDHDVSDWLPRLRDIDVVVNAVGILRETKTAAFDAVHIAAPVALFRACAQAGVGKVLQVSAVGADAHARSGYHRSKQQADQALAVTCRSWVIVQPSLVFGVGGASASLFTRLAALPWVPFPGSGQQQVQPIHVDDLTAAIVRLIETNEFDCQTIPAVGPRAITLREFLGALRRAMGLGKPIFLPVPMLLVRGAAAMGDRLPGVLLDRESLAMLIRGNVASATLISRVLNRAPRAVESFIDASSASVIAMDARLAWLLPLLRFSIALVWIVTGIVSMGVYPVSESYALLARVGLTGVAASIALYGAALLDFAFGVSTLWMHSRRWLWRAQMLVVIAYTAIITVYLPEFWLHPYGPVLKNLPLLAAILMLHELEPQITR